MPGWAPPPAVQRHAGHPAPKKAAPANEKFAGVPRSKKKGQRSSRFLLQFSGSIQFARGGYAAPQTNRAPGDQVMKLTPTLGGTLSGSLGGLTASHNKGGLYLRRRSIPTNPNTARQQAVRALMSTLGAAWTSQLSDAQRLGWANYAAAVPVQDKIGMTINLTGQQMFVRSNTPRLQASNTTLTAATQTLLEDAPTTDNTGEGPVSIDTFEVEQDDSAMTIAGNLNAAASDDGIALLRIGPFVNAGVNHIKNTLQLAAAVAISATDTTYSFTDVDINATTDWVANTIPVANDQDQRFPVSIRISYDDGRVTTRYMELKQLTLAPV